MKISKLVLLTGIVLLFACTREAREVKEASEAEQKLADIERSVIDAQQRKARILLDNEYIRVVRVILAPNEKQDEHPGGHRIIYSLSDYTINWTKDRVDLGTKAWKREDVHYHVPDMHYIHNLGRTYADFIVFNRKGFPLPENMMGISSTLLSKGGEFSSRKLENDYFTVIKMQIPAGQTISEFRSKSHLIHARSEFKLRYVSDTGKTREVSLRDGNVVWTDAGTYSMVNIGDSDAVFLMVGIRQ